jgi:hypothetical protein
VIPRDVAQREHNALSIGAVDLPPLRNILPIAMRVIAQFAFIEARVTPAFAALVGTKYAAMVAILEATPTGLGQRLTVFKDAAKELAAPGDKQMVADVLEAVHNAGNHRHKLAHWLWACIHDKEDELYLVRPRSYAAHVGDWLETRDSIMTFTAAVDSGRPTAGMEIHAIRLYDSGAVVAYSRADLELVAKQVTLTAPVMPLLQSYYSPENDRGRAVARESLLRQIETLRALRSP